LRRQLLRRRGLADRSQLFHPPFRSNLSSRFHLNWSQLFRLPLRSSRGRAWLILLRLLFRRCRRGHRSRLGGLSRLPLQSRDLVLPSQRSRLLLRSRQLQTFGDASRNQRSRQRKLRRCGHQRLLASKSQRSASSLNFGRLLCRVRAWMRLSMRVRGMQAWNHLRKSLSLLAMRR
jgi:hypothetical protein